MSNENSAEFDSRRRPERPDIDVLLAELAESGQSTAAFARERGIPSWKLYNALRARSGKRRRARGRRSSDLVPVRLVDEASSEAPVELVLAGGHCLRVRSGFDEATLRRLMGVLGGC